MSRFVENAERIFEAAESAGAAGHSLSEMTILIAPTGGISLVAGAGRPLDSLRQERGAEMAYRVSHERGVVRVEGRAGSRTCLFEAAKPERAARLLLEGTPLYEIIPASSQAESCCRAPAAVPWPKRFLEPAAATGSL